MKGGMNPKRGGEPETHSTRINDGPDLKRTNKPGRLCTVVEVSISTDLFTRLVEKLSVITESLSQKLKRSDVWYV